MVHGGSSSSDGKSDIGKFVRDFMLGGVAGAIAKTLSAPIERVKLLLQTQHNNPKLAERPYKGIIDCFSRCVSEEGVVSLWRGNWANVLRYFPTQAINFSIKDGLNRTFVKGVDHKRDPFKFFLASLLAGGIAGKSFITQDLLVCCSFILWISPEQDWELILGEPLMRESSMG